MNIKIIAKDIRLRSIERKDIEFCRKLKNANKKIHFYQEDIDKDSQIKWYENVYRTDCHNVLFVIEKSPLWFKIGCIGIKVRENYTDIYNLMLLRHINVKYAKKAIKLVNKIVTTKLTTLVRRDDVDGFRWYLKNGFSRYNESDQYYQFKLDE